VHFAHRRVDRIDRDEAQAEVLIEILVGGNIAATTLQPHFHVEASAFADGGNVDVLIEHFHVGIGFDHAAGDFACLIGLEINGLGTFARQLEGHLLQVEDDVGSVFHHAGNGLELVQHAFDLDGGDSGAFDGGKQHAPQAVAVGGA